MPNGPVTFLLVDGHEIVRIGIRWLLRNRSHWRIVSEASTAAEALALAEQLLPQVALVDLTLKDGNGLDLIRDLRASHPALRILVNSVHEEALFADLCLQAGACGYVWKGEPAERLVAAIGTVLAGGVYVSDATAELHAERERLGIGAYTPLESLTPRERDVYALVAQGYDVKKIASQMQISAKTVEYHRQQIKKKLSLESSTALNRYAMLNGLPQE